MHKGVVTNLYIDIIIITPAYSKLEKEIMK